MGNNHKVIGTLSITFLVMFGALFSPGYPAPVDHAPDPSGKDHDKPSVPSFDEEQQLKDLKQSLGKTFSILKSQVSVQYSDAGKNEGSHVERKEEAQKDGQLVARLTQKVDSVGKGSGDGNATPVSLVRTEIEIPSQGIHEIAEGPLGTLGLGQREIGIPSQGIHELAEGPLGNLGLGQREVADNMERRSPSPPGISNQIDGKYTSFSGVQYSPRDMAEYVFWTGDEKGVTLAIEEFLEDGLMTRKDAISFLQEIKTNLDDLQMHYSRQQRFQKHADSAAAQQEKGNTGSSKGLLKKKGASHQVPKEPKEISADKKNSRDLPPVEAIQDDRDLSMTPAQQNRDISDEDYEELLDRLKVADFLYTEYSLEEVIYQLAKVIFSQSLTKGSLEAQEALQKFTNFLETEAQKGHISKGLEKKVLDVLIASFADTIAEHPDLVVKSRPREVVQEAQSPSANQLLHQLVLLNPSANEASPKPEKGNIGSQKTQECENIKKNNKRRKLRRKKKRSLPLANDKPHLKPKKKRTAKHPAPPSNGPKALRVFNSPPTNPGNPRSDRGVGVLSLQDEQRKDARARRSLRRLQKKLESRGIACKIKARKRTWELVIQSPSTGPAANHVATTLSDDNVIRASPESSSPSNIPSSDFAIPEDANASETITPIPSSFTACVPDPVTPLPTHSDGTIPSPTIPIPTPSCATVPNGTSLDATIATTPIPTSSIPSPSCATVPNGTSLDATIATTPIPTSSIPTSSCATVPNGTSMDATIATTPIPTTPIPTPSCATIPNGSSADATIATTPIPTSSIPTPSCATVPNGTSLDATIATTPIPTTPIPTPSCATIPNGSSADATIATTPVPTSLDNTSPTQTTPNHAGWSSFNGDDESLVFVRDEEDSDFDFLVSNGMHVVPLSQQIVIPATYDNDGYFPVGSGGMHSRDVEWPPDDIITEGSSDEDDERFLAWEPSRTSIPATALPRQSFADSTNPAA